MGRRTFTTAEKLAIAHGWLVARTQGETQETYALKHNTTSRRVREFVAVFIVPVPMARVRHIVETALALLNEVLQRLDQEQGREAHASENDHHRQDRADDDRGHAVVEAAQAEVSFH